MEYLIFYRTQGYYYVIDKNIVEDGHGEDPYLIREDEYGNSRIFFKECFARMGYSSLGFFTVLESKDYIYVEKNTLLNYLFLKFINRKYFVESIVNAFRLRVRQQLFDLLGSKEFSIFDILSAFKKYTMQDEFTLWMFNDETKVYTPISSSYRTECEYIRRGDSTRFDDFLHSDALVEEGEILKSKHSNVDKRGNKWRTWIKLDLGLDGQSAILAFYSKYEGFGIQSTVIKDIKQLVELRYNSDARISYKDLYRSVNELLQLEHYDPESVLDKTASLLKLVLKYEAASSFVYDSSNESLTLVSTYDCSSPKKITDRSVIYDKSFNSLSMKSCENKDALLIVYDINTEENSKRYSEVTDSDPVNWVGMPICLNGELYGFLRAKNKYTMSGGTKIITAPSPLDHFNLIALRAFVEAVLEVVNRNVELEDKLLRHDNIAKVFMHEIRGPVGSIASIPDQVIDQIYCLECDQEDKDKIISNLEDVASLANVLSFIVQATDVEQLLSREYPDSSLSVLKGLIVPANKLLKNYFDTQYQSELIFDHHSLRGAHVYGNDKLLMMVLFALLDNAGKYQFDESGIIKVYGEYKEKGEFVNIYVENHGVEIKEYERELIFQRDYRGDNARSTGAHGSGIGLWLCNEIAKKFGGDISVDSPFNPVRFRLKLINSRSSI